MINTVRRFDKTKPYDAVNTIDGRPRLAFLSTVESFYCTKRLTICYYMHVLLYVLGHVFGEPEIINERLEPGIW